MKTHECLDIVLTEYKDFFCARDLARISGVPEVTLSLFRNGEKNTGVKIFDKIREGLKKLSPEAYQRFIELLAEAELEPPKPDLVKLIAEAPFSVQAEVLKTIASNGVFTLLSELAQEKRLIH
ncbi:hypothetical protein [Cyanobacterium aponinum]|uniref:Uncharacterized protein n=1 Tax=Cyanobacterium aponinum (strain PCC 10605) TaxID=755178 RepID=K9ZAV6_CYAAP|nr:hypothetical protein [Cyanobacterium aponinum]AFZ55523.1 hypothetical protein Cyan10605_3488 [Cyanobacterium aponinum PCC 10605]